MPQIREINVQLCRKCTDRSRDTGVSPPTPPVRPAAVYMSEWERSKAQPAKDKAEEGAAEAPEGEGEAEGSSSSSSGWPPASVGVTYELCAGLVDKADLSLEEIARQEVLEECGYDVPASKLKRITSYRSAPPATPPPPRR